MARHEPRLEHDWTDQVTETFRIRRSLVLAMGLLTVAATVSAQTAAPAPPDKGYAEAVAASAFSDVTSQSYGAEVGVTVMPKLQVFGSFGQIRNVATSEISASSSTIASALAQLQPGAVSYTVKEPATFVVGGVRFLIPTTWKVKPYILGGAGVASVSKDVKFFIDGADASSTLPQYVTLGSDVSGTESKLMIAVGGGVVWPAWRQLIVDLQYQYNHISTDTAISVNRAGVGVGVRF
jgi:opacity protein-like surface antigen